MKKVLIANRGEIAIRIRKAAESLGITPVMLSSDADRGALHTQGGAEVLYLEGSSAQETYLNAEKIIELAKGAGCDAIHPGYGFLSEDAPFAELVENAAIRFIGPSSEVIRTMGDKIIAKQIAAKAGVPQAASVEIHSPKEALKLVEEQVGFPIILKAKAGGGGRGMRLVEEAKSFLKECERAQAEALKFFGNGTIFAERYIGSPRHVEVQVFGDGKGKAYHLGTRDCSAQRRHQKLVEEAPAPFLSDTVRELLHSSAVSLAEIVKYEGAGTVEFLVEGEQIFFLEMNTRIQVEHPVTEEVYGIDLVAWQFRVAMGEPLDEKSFTAIPQCHCIEFRIYAENPAKNFSPDLGQLTHFEVPQDEISEREVLRVDSGMEAGSTITPFYDAMLTKIIVSGKNRNDCLKNARRVLKRCIFKGVETSLPFHLWLLHESSFSTSPLEISFIDKHFSAESLASVARYSEIDAAHELHDFPYEKAEQLSIAEEDGTRASISLIHRTDGLFEARKDDGSAFISQTKKGALSAL